MRSIVWLKRDLRLSDHAPLWHTREDACLVVYIDEPSRHHAADLAECHRRFIYQCLADVFSRVRALGGTPVFFRREAVECLERLYEQWQFDRIVSHQETGNRATFDRDRAVSAWCRKHAVTWEEYRQHGVIRGLQDRDGWSARWRQLMQERIISSPQSLHGADVAIESACPIPAHDPEDGLQQGGEHQAASVLEGFLNERGQRYRTEMSSPVTAWEGCSRLSPHLAFGSISVRSVHQRTEERRAEIRVASPKPPHWAGSLTSFAKRLRWHCHFMQKLEDEPAIEFENMSRVYDGLREDSFNEVYFQAWKQGQTGYPMVDACMRALQQHKWINFRMRAMLVSFASYHLWLDWRPTSKWLSQHFLDYEPGIHYSQFQMQSGVTGINALRIYSPAKQVKDQDPQGEFIRRYCPELEGVPPEYLANPETMSQQQQSAAGCRIGKDYPQPIVDHKTAYAAARQAMGAVRRRAEAREEAQKVYQKHGSRRRPRRRA